ncbi:hypothetical protein IQ07DRAFT_686151 [Pyrenochaeta sp. DS3sAY3a]|nr:hypothetical protein IQ07DRAFT_686151 [Pyrenochaeta sp. DS3sAY3a]
MSGGSEQASPGKGNPSEYDCPHCDLSFRRREHLSRHLDRHSGARPHQCTICMKTFPRNDTLKRHVTTHGPAALADWVNKNPNHNRRACQACAKGKQRCDGNGTTACGNCVSRSRRCVYRPSTSESGNDLVSGEATVSELCDLSAAPGHPQSPGSISPIQEESMAAVPEDIVVEPMQHTAMGFSPSSQPVADASLLNLQLESFSETFMFSSGSSFPVTPMPAYGLGGISDFYFGNDALTSTTFLMPEQGTIGSDSLACPFELGLPSKNSTNRREYCMADDEDILSAEYVPHVPRIDGATRNHMVNMLNYSIPQPEASHIAEAFPSLRYLDAYVQLYFEHFHRRWPVLHVPTFQMSPQTWQLAFSVAFIGCQFSEANQKSKHLKLFYQLSPRVLNIAPEEIFDKDHLACMQSLLLLQHCMLFAGDRKTFIQLQSHRSVLITLSRQLLSQDGTVLHRHDVAERAPNPWLQWVRNEAERRVLYFTWMTECLQAALFLIPPLLTIAEMQIPLPGPDAHWEASRQQWQHLAPPQSPTPVCAMITSIGLQSLVPHNLGPSARLTTLLSSFVQYTAAQDLGRAMMLYTVDSSTMQSPSSSGAVADILRVALDVLCKFGCSQVLKLEEAHSISNDFSIMARVLTILDFAPGRLLYPFTRWQSSDHGANHARKELSRIVSHDIGRARHCIHQAAQLFQYFRMVSTLRHIDTISLLLCTAYIHIYIELVVKQRANRDAQADMLDAGKLIRLDKVSENTQIDDWLSLKHDDQPHITGIGVLEADRSTARLYKETSRIMGRSASKSSFAAALQPIMDLQAAGNAPVFQDKR